MTVKVAESFPRGDWVDELVRQSLSEDLGSGDVSTAVLGNAAEAVTGAIVAREAGCIAGLPLLDLLFGQLDPRVNVAAVVAEGECVAPGQSVAQLCGPVGSILSGERTALNFLQHLGGIATMTADYVAAVAGTRCRVLDTRKTLPGYRHLAKYAVRCGGGHNHRLGLYDRVMLKDNHWVAGGGQIEELVVRAREMFPLLSVEVEVDSVAQLQQVLPLAVEWVLLDNFSFAETRQAVELRDRIGARTLLESSGNVTLETIAGYAGAGVDAASVGRLTHSARALDLGLDF